MIPDHDAYMFLLHGGPGMFVLGDALLKDADLVRRHAMSPAKGARAIVQYGAAYFMWSVFCVTQNGGNWPYPFQPRLSAIQHILFVGVVLVVASYMSKYGAKISGRMDRRRRRRILNEAKQKARNGSGTAGARAKNAKSAKSGRSLGAGIEIS